MNDSTAAATHDVHHHGSFITTYVFSTDHKMIAKQFFWLALVMMILGGSLALMFRWQIAWPETQVWGFGWLSDENEFMPTGRIGPDVFNMLVTMHATIMVFFVIMPMFSGAFSNFLIPLMIGARDMAFPFLNMLSFWVAALSALIMLSGFFVEGGHAAAGWTSYAPLSMKEEYTGVGAGQTLWALSIFVLTIGSLMGSVNYITTIINMRTKGMHWFRMPTTVWALLVVAILSLLALPVLGAAGVLMIFDRVFETAFFDPQKGGQPLLWQHLFWYFGHPEVYILILPAMGIASDILSVFSRKPIFGYRAMVYAIIGIAFIGWAVWGHHMFLSGMNPRLASAFMVSTMLIAIPSAIKTFNWLGTLWRGSIRFTVPMLHALAFVAMFVIGGLSGIFMAANTVDIFIHDTYFIVAHIHYVLFGGSIFGLFAAVTYWFPKMFGRMMNDSLGRIHFWITFVAFNIVFFPQHILGIAGHMRRIYDPLQYEFLKGLEPINVLITLGALALGIGQIIFAINVFGSLWKLNAKWFRTSAQVVTSFLCGFLGYRTVAIALEGLTKPAAATMGGRIFATLIFAVVFALVFKYLSSKMGEIGETAPQNPWQANTLEWVAPAIPPHGNFGPTLPVVHRGPYEYSVPGESEDWAPQTTPMSEEAASAAH